MISAKYFMHQNSATGQDSLNESLFLSEGAYQDNDCTIIVIGDDYNLDEELALISEGWLSNKFKGLQRSINRFINRRVNPALDKAKEKADSFGKAIGNTVNKISSKIDNANKDMAKRRKVADLVLDKLGETEMTAAIVNAVHNAQNIKFIQAGNRLTMNVGDDGMRQLRGVKVDLGNKIVKLRDRMVYDINGKKIKFDFFNGNILITE